MAIYVFQNGGWPPSWIFAEVKFEGISVLGRLFLSLNQIWCECVQLRLSYGH